MLQASRCIATLFHNSDTSPRHVDIKGTIGIPGNKDVMLLEHHARILPIESLVILKWTQNFQFNRIEFNNLACLALAMKKPNGWLQAWLAR